MRHDIITEMKLYLTIIHYILITACIYLGVDLFYDVFVSRLNNVFTSPATNKHVSIAGDQASRSLDYYQAINRRNLFNIKTNAPKAQNISDSNRIDDLEQTSLNLKLWGTVSGTDNKDYAVIESSSGEQNLYRVGDAIQMATVKLILREKVVLSINGKDEILEMEKFSSSGKAGPKRAAPPSLSQRIPLKRSQVADATQNVNQLLPRAPRKTKRPICCRC